MKEYIMIKEIGNAPITVAELVRCKDCKFHHPSEKLNKCWCEKDFIEGYHNRDWFCADGERRAYVKPVTGSATDWNGIECE